MKYITTNFFASTYGSGSYGSGTYNSAAITNPGGTGNTTGSGTISSSSGGTLTNTGFDLALVATLACTIVFVALAVRFWKRPAKVTSTDRED